ncbi:conserved oligomeric Golgi complex subunit 3-like isoform X3 [Branchiostoma floridae x Branchiostoma belcheri]
MADAATNARSSSAMVSPKVLSSKLGEWDRKQGPTAQLTERQRDSFMDLTAHAQTRPLPIQLPLEDGGYVQRTALHGLGARLGTGDQDAVLKGFSSLQMEEEKIENAQKFFSWFTKVESMIEEEEELCYRFPAERLKQHRKECDDVLGDVCSALDHLQELQKQYIFVSTKTNALHEACEHLLQEQTKLVNAAESINNKLSYFTELERISTKLNSPAMSVTSDSFVPMLSRIDECVAYINSHPDFAECDVYLARFRQCLSKALNLIKTYVVNLLQQASQQVQPKGKDAQGPSDNAFTLYYGKFRTNAPRVKLLMEQIEDRIDRSPEYQQLLNDCHQCYFNQRQLLLGPSVQTAVTEMAGHHVRDHCALVRSGCAFMVHVCQDEHQLFAHFFSRKTPKLDVLLEGLCNSLYDVLRPLIIHIQHLETLSELCSILRVEMLEEHVQNNPDELRAFETVALQMLEDVQERLVYRAHIYIQTDIQSYGEGVKSAISDYVVVVVLLADELRAFETVALQMLEDVQERLVYRAHIYIQTDIQSYGEGVKSAISDHVVVVVLLADELRAFETVALQMLEDVQERLVYRAHIYIQTDIQSYGEGVKSAISDYVVVVVLLADELRAFETVALQMLEDVQERLVYRAHIYIQTDIQSYGEGVKSAISDVVVVVLLADELRAFETVALQMLEDVQERLVYRAHIYIQTDIQSYGEGVKSAISDYVVVVVLLADELRAFETVALQMLEDVQERLVYRAHIYIQTDIQSYGEGVKSAISDVVVVLLADELRAFETVALQMLEDVQERLVYRAHIYIQTDIQSYGEGVKSAISDVVVVVLLADELRAFETVALQMLEDVQEKLVYRAHIYIQTDIQSYGEGVKSAISDVVVVVLLADELRAFETVALQMLEDVQERLVYRAHIYIQTDIQSYGEGVKSAISDYVVVFMLC